MSGVTRGASYFLWNPYSGSGLGPTRTASFAATLRASMADQLSAPSVLRADCLSGRPVRHTAAIRLAPTAGPLWTEPGFVLDPSSSGAVELGQLAQSKAYRPED